MIRMRHHLKEIMDEDAVVAPEEVVDVVVIIFGDVMVIILNHMKINTMRYEKGNNTSSSKKYKNNCYRCGIENQWS
jgi:hypothetical protein